MAQVNDVIAAKVTLNASGAIKDLGTLSRKAKETDRAFSEAGQRAQFAGARIADGTTRAGTAATRSTGAFSDLSSGVRQASSSLSIFGLAAGTVGTATAGLFSAVNAASKLNEQVSASRVTFGDAGKQVRAWSETTSGALGISAAQALKASSSFGSFFKQAGFSQGAAAKMSTALVQLAGDIASFKDVDVDTALTAISAGLAGESEPMRRLGADLRITRVEADALKYGFAATRAEITETDRTAARFLSMLDQLKDAQGDAARTANDYANTQRRFNASLDELRAAGGQKTLPFLTDMTEGLTTLIDVANKGPKAFSAAGVSIGEAGKALAKAAGLGAATGGGAFFPVLFSEMGKAGRGAEETLSKQAAAMKVYDDAVAAFGRTSPQATGAQGALRREMDEAERQNRQSAQAQESTTQATARFRAESSAAVGTIRSFLDAQRGAEDANLRVGDSRRGLADAERSLSELRRKGKVDAAAVADAEQRVRDASLSTADARLRFSDAEERLSELRAKGAVDAKRVVDAERSVADASRGVAAARRAVAEAEKEVARLRAGPTGDEATEAARAIARAQLDLERAQQRQLESLNELNQSRGADTLDAALGVRDAELSLAEAIDNLRHAQEAQQALNERGLSGSAAMTEAEQRLADARQQEADATHRQREAEQAARDARAGDPEFAEKIAALTRDVESAKRAVESATRGEAAAAKDLREARAGDPEFEHRLADAGFRVRDARLALKRAEEELPFAADAARTAQQNLHADLQAAVPTTAALAANLGLLAERYRALASAQVIGPSSQFGNIAPRPGTPTVPLGTLPGRAHGGPVTAGHAYIVGENRRPELFVPDASGFIYPRVPAGGSGSGSAGDIVITVNSVLDGQVVARSVTRHQAGTFLRGGRRP